MAQPIAEIYRDKKTKAVSIAVTNGFDIKDELKAAGYAWNASSKTWDKEVSVVEFMEIEKPALDIMPKIRISTSAPLLAIERAYNELKK